MASGVALRSNTANVPVPRLSEQHQAGSRTSGRFFPGDIESSDDDNEDIPADKPFRPYQPSTSASLHRPSSRQRQASLSLSSYGESDDRSPSSRVKRPRDMTESPSAKRLRTAETPTPVAGHAGIPDGEAAELRRAQLVSQDDGTTSSEDQILVMPPQQSEDEEEYVPPEASDRDGSSETQEGQATANGRPRDEQHDDEQDGADPYPYDDDSEPEENAEGARKTSEAANARNEQASREESPLFVPDATGTYQSQPTNGQVGEDLADGRTGPGSPELGSNDVSRRGGSGAEQPEHVYNPPQQQNPDSSLMEADEARNGQAHINFFEPPVSEDAPTITIGSNFLGEMLSDMGNKAWVGGGIDWEEHLLLREGESPSQWYSRHAPRAKTARCKELLSYTNKLWRFFHKVPTTADMQEQIRYLQQDAKSLNMTMQNTNGTIVYICNRMSKVRKQHNSQSPQKDNLVWAAGTAKSLYRCIIPQLLLTLKEVFLLGCDEPREFLESLPQEGQFSTSTLQVLARIVGWVDRLYSDMITELQLHPPRQPKIHDDDDVENQELRRDPYFSLMQYRGKLRKQLDQFGQSIEKALRELDSPAELLRKQRAMENDRRLRQEREEEQRKRREALDQQKRLYLASARRSWSIRGSQPSSQPPSSLAQRPVQTRKQLTQEEYAQRNRGWSWDEDDQLLTMLRRAPPHPDVTVLAELFPGRGVQEVRQRVSELRDMARRKYEGWKMVPPLWCQSS